VLYLSHPSSLAHDPRVLMPGHPDTPERLIRVEAALAERDWLGMERRQAPAASEADLELIHSRHLVESIRELCCADGGRIDADTTVSPASWEAALHAAGGACELARALLAGEDTAGFCSIRPSGHHAEPDRAMGFCLFDNVAIAAATAIDRFGAERVLILDWDVHHGNGTEAAFRDRADVLVVNIHQMPLYPGTGAAEELGQGEGRGFNVNLPVPPGSGEETWLSLVEHVVVPLGESFRPDLVLISAGFDAHRADPLANCELEAESFARIARQVRDMGARTGAGVGAVQEGGYEPAALVESLLATLPALAGEGVAVSAPAESPLAAEARARLAPFWGF
jgi:acetoin utilization deacetylase AcuC-like enzyme